MKNQIYIFLAIITLIIGCKTDSSEVEPDNIFHWFAEEPQQFSRANSIIDYNSDILSPISINFENEISLDGSYTYNLWLDGGDTLLFAEDDNCYLSTSPSQIISDTLSFSSTISIFQLQKGDTICTPLDTFYIGFKRIYNNNHRTTFGWFRITTPIKGFYAIDEMGWNYANHQPIKVAQKQ